MEETFSTLKADFLEFHQNSKQDVAVSGGPQYGGDAPTVEHISVAGLPHLGGCTHASLGNGQIHVAAVVGAKVSQNGGGALGIKGGALVGGGVQGQTYRCFQIIEEVLHVCSGQWGDLVRLTVHLADLGEAALEAFEQAADFFFQERGCPSVAISVVGCAQLLLSAAVQIEGLAVDRHSMGSVMDRCVASPEPTTAGTSVGTACSGGIVVGRWRSRDSSSDCWAAAAPSSGGSVPPPLRQPLRPSLGNGQLQGTSASRHPTPAERLQRSRPPPRNRQNNKQGGRSPGASQQSSPRLAPRGALGAAGGGHAGGNAGRGGGAPEEVTAESAVETLTPAIGTDVTRELSPALRWLSQQVPPDEAAAQAELVMPPGDLVVPGMRRDSGLEAQEQLFLSTSQMDELSRQLGLSGTAPSEPVWDSGTDGGEATAPRRVRRTWVQKPKGEATSTPQIFPLDTLVRQMPTTIQPERCPQVVAPGAHPSFWPRSETSGNAYVREGSPILGHEASLNLMELPAEQARQLGLRFQADHNVLFRVQMEADGASRTARLGPGDLLCKHLPGCKRVWSYTFDVVVANTMNSFVNVGLVEWVAADKDGQSNESPPSVTRAGEVSLSDLLAVEASEARMADLAWQHASESPRQMMLGCRKGVKWYGNNCSEPVFNDDLCDGSLLHFRCDYTFSPEGVPVQVRLWFLPSPVVFRRQGRQVAQLPGPLFEYQMPTSSPSGDFPATRSMWVPAVTLFTQNDTVLFAWRGSVRGVGPGGGQNMGPALQATEAKALEAPLLQVRDVPREAMDGRREIFRRFPVGARSPQRNAPDETPNGRRSARRASSRLNG